MKDIYSTRLQDFADLCNSYGVNTSNNLLPEKNKSTPTTSKTLFQSPTKSMASDRLLPFNTDHEVCLNDDFPHLDDSGLLIFRDDDVEIDDTMVSILTVYKELTDARDQEFTTLSIHKTNPSILVLNCPKLGLFMTCNHDKVQGLEKCKKNPEFYTSTAKKHKKIAFRIKGNRKMRMRTIEFQLPFELSPDEINGMNNTGSELMKNFRSLNVEVNSNFTQTCSFVFWKILIYGETQVCYEGDEEMEAYVYNEAIQRELDAFTEDHL